MIKVPDPRGGIEEMAQCIYCKELYIGKSSPGGTGHLLRHMKSCMPRHVAGNAGAGGGSGTVQTQLSQTDSSGGLGVFNCDPNNARYQLIKIWIVHQLPIVLAEDWVSENFLGQAFVPSW